MSNPARRIQTTLTAHRHLTAAVEARLPATLSRLTTELDAQDGYPPTASGSDNGPPSPFIPIGPNASTSSTERAAIAPDERNDTDTRAIGARAALDEIQGLLDAANLALETICRECDARTPGITTIDISRLRCATIPAGACTQWADPARNDGLCCDHGRTADSNRRRQHRYRNGAAAVRLPAVCKLPACGCDGLAHP